jgi:hypothetical protein
MYKREGMYGQPQLAGFDRAGMYGQPQLGDIFADIKKIAGKVGAGAGQVEEIASQVSDVAAGKKKVALIPPTGGFATIPIPGQPYGITVPIMPILLGAGALLALYMISRRR